jgi:mannose-1-phosphate guanylyltransferase
MVQANGGDAGSSGLAKTKAVILVGGVSKATRFRPLSLDLPKPLFPIAGLPMIQHHVEALGKISCLSEIILLGFFDEELFAGFMETVSETLNIPVRYLREETACGTAGGLYRYRDVIMQGSPDAVFVMHCDVGCTFPLQDMLAFHLSSKKDCTVLGKELTDSEAHNYGAMVVDEKTSELVHYAEKPVTDISCVVNAGVYIFSPALFEHVRKVGDEVNRGSTYRPYFSAKEAQNIYIEQDILMSLAGRGRVFVFETSGFWCQIKDPAGALRCSGEYLEHFRTKRPEFLAKSSAGMRAKVGRSSSGTSFAGIVGVGSSKLTIVDAVFIDASATVHPTAVIGPNAVIGAGASIGPGARVKDSIVLEDCHISDHAVVIGSIVGWGSSGMSTRAADCSVLDRFCEACVCSVALTFPVFPSV